MEPIELQSQPEKKAQTMVVDGVAVIDLESVSC